QYEAPIPMPDPAGLPSLLDRALNAILPPAKDRAKHDEFNSRIASAYHLILRTYLRQPRDIGRLANALQVSMANLYGQVDATDFIVLETLRLFDNEAYLAVRDNLDWLTGEAGWANDSKMAAEIKQRLSTCKHPKEAEDAIASLFPRASAEWKAYMGEHKGPAQDAADRRI